MKLFLAVTMFLGFISLSSNSVAAIGCLPGDCCNGHPCSEPGPTPKPPPPPPQCPPHGGRPVGMAMNEVMALQVGCAAQVKQDCSQCGSDVTSCEIQYQSGTPVQAVCKYCN